MIEDHIADGVGINNTSSVTHVPLHEHIQFNSVTEHGDFQSASAFMLCSNTLDLSEAEQGQSQSSNIYKVWDTHQEESTLPSSTQTIPNENQIRARKKKRPFSPEPIGREVRNTNRGKTKKKARKIVSGDEVHGNSFSCDKCGSLSIVNPSRRRLAPSQVKKAPCKRKKVDPESQKVLNLCNACGLAFSRPTRKKKQIIISTDDRDKYLAEATAFAKSIAERISEPAAERLFCPSFKNRPCRCLQTYLSQEGNGEDTLKYRVETLLQLFRTACDLNRRRNIFPDYQVTEQKSNANPVERKQRQRDYEHFVLETRQMLREKPRLCERACQRILLYSNNFLHKKLKTSPDQSSRISRQLGNHSSVQLKPISELGSVTCCVDNCSRLALTHCTLLEEWRKQAAQGQRQARRVLAEMLTPSGGTKANCYKFISMVTGCGPTTISSVSHQMRVTKGNREPPEHGLKKWYRANPRKLVKAPGIVCSQKVEDSSSASVYEPDLEPKSLVELQRKELEEAKRLLQIKQQELDHCRLIIDQHLQQQTLSVDNSSNNPLWKVNVIRSTLEEDENGPQLINLPVEPNVNMVPEMSSGQALQFIDLVPGTYIAVPSTFDSSAVLTVNPDSRDTIINSDSFASGSLSDQQGVVFPGTLTKHPNPCKTNNLYLHYPNDGQTTYKICSIPEEANTILGMESEIQPLEGGTEVFVPAPAVCDDISFPTCNADQQAVSVLSAHNLESLGSSDGSVKPLDSIRGVSTFQAPETSCRTSVITPAKLNDSEKSMSECQTSSLGGHSIFKCSKTGECGESFELSSVILLSSQQSQPTENSLNSLNQFFE